MKRLLKRTLSLILAMIMVMGVLPMNTMAAMIMGDPDGGRLETPVIDRSDPIVDTHAKSISTGHERPEIPPEESEQPADPLWANSGFASVTINSDGTWEVQVATDAADNTASGAWVLALIPDTTASGGDVTPSEMWDNGDIGSGANSEGNMSGILSGGTGQVRDTHYIAVSGSDLRSSGGVFTISNSSSEITTTNSRVLPDAATLADGLGLSTPFTVRAFFYCQGSTTMVVSDTSNYGEVAVVAGIPSTTYVLNKSTGTLTYLSGTLGGKPWNPDGVANNTQVSGSDGNWDGVEVLTIPVYNTTEGALTVNTPGYTPPTGVTGGAMTDATLDGNSTKNATFTVNANSGTITLPISAEDADGTTLPPATITVQIVSGAGIIMEPVVFDVDYGFDSAVNSDPLQAAMVTTSAGAVATWDAIVFNLPAGFSTATIWTWTPTGTTPTADYKSVLEPKRGVEADIRTTTAGSNNTRQIFVTNPSKPPKVNAALAAVGDATGLGTTLITLNPNNSIWTLKNNTTTTYTVDVMTQALAVRNGTTTAAVLTTNGSTIPYPKIPVTVNVHGGYAVFHHKDGSTTTVAGVPSETVAAANTVGGVGVPTGSWARNASDATALTAGQIVLGGRDATRHYYEINLVVDTTVAFNPKDGTTATTKTGAPGNTTTAPTGYTAGTTKKTISGTDYVFKGWSEAEVNPGNTATTTTTFTFPDSGTKTYYGVWTEQTTITYNVNWPTTTGTIGPAPNAPSANTGDKGRTIDTTASTLALTDTNGQYTFGGWYKEAACTNAAGDNYAADANATLYAQWTPVTHTVTYATGTTDTVTGMPSPTSVTGILHATSHTISSAEPTRTGYTFTGWKSNVSGDNNNYKKDGTGNQTSITVNADITLTAQWSIDQYTLRYDMNGHGTSLKPSSSTHDYNSTPTLSATPAVNSKVTESNIHWVFKGWSATDSGTTAITTITMDNDKTVYAIWEKDTHTVTYDGNNGTLAGDHTSATKTCGDSYTISSNEPTRDGYTFTGWNTAANGSGTPYAKSATITAVTGDITLYAQWQIKTYTVTYNKGDHGGSDVPEATNHNHGTTANVNGTMANSTEAGIHWLFKGWSTTKNDASTKVTQFANITENKTVYALWEKDTHTVAYNANGGTLASSHTTATVECDGEYTISNDEPTRANSIFLGWATTQNGAVAYAKGAKIENIKSDITLYAQWQATVTVTFNTDGGTWATADGGGTGNKTQTGVSGNTMTKYTDPTKKGFEFAGWDPAVTTNAGGDWLFPNSATTYTAQWTQLYTVKFDVNNANVTGVTTPTSATGKKVGETVTTSTLTDTAGDYVFKGWALSSNGNVSVNGGGNYTVAAANAAATPDATTGEKVITLYAIWVKKTVVTYKVNGGVWADNTTADITEKGEPGVDNTNKPTDPTREGYDFTGWLPTVPAKFPNADTAYTAQWGVKQYTVSFLWNTTAHSHTATEVYKTTKGNYGAAITAPSPAPSMTGYTFGGWYKEAACTNAMSNADTYPAHDDLKMYAKWTPINYTITYADPQSGAASGMPSPLAQTAAYDSTHTLASAPTGKTGYVWDGWYDGNTKVSANFTVTGNRTLNAKWRITVSFEIHDPQATATLTDPAAQTIDAGSTITLPSQTDLTDYKFLGWFSAADGGTKKASTDTYSVPTTLHAQWEAKTYTYTFDPNNGSFPGGTTNTSTSGAVGTTIPAPSNDPTRTNYTFLGWGSDNTNDASKIVTPATKMPSGGGTVYAVWKANTYGYVFDPNEGSFANDEPGLQTGDGTVKKTGAAGATVDAPTDPTRTKYKFDGWYTGKTDGTKVTTHTITGNSTDGAVTNTVYAHWIPLYDVTYNAGGHGTVDTSKNDLNKAARSYSVLGGSEVITTGGTWSGDYFTDTAGKHWKFNGWQASSDNSKLYSKGNNLTVNQDVTLTAQWDEYYLVTLAPPVLTDTTTALGDHVTVKLGGSSRDSSHSEGNRQVWVKKNDSLPITELALKANATKYIFAKWTATASTGAFGTDGATAQTTAYTPTADTTLTPNYWRWPILTDKDSYHQNFATGATVANDKWGSATYKKGTNTLPEYTWTKNSAALAGSDELQIDIDGTWTTLTLGTDVVKSVDASTGNVTYTFQRDYLMTLKVPMGDTCRTYNIRVKSDTPDTTTTNHADTTLTAVLEIAVNPDPLTEVNIQVEDTTSATANVGVTTRDSVIYKDHKSTTITKTNQLTYTWYVSNNATTPTQKSYSTSLAGHAASVTGAKNDAAALGTVIGTADTTNDFVNLTAAHKGKYIYAVVAATNTGYGAVITNAIAVDYDAVIKVTKDGNTSITGGNYTVYLVPQPTTGNNADGYTAANLPTGKVPATYDSGNQYKTADSALTGGVTYDVYVNKVEGDATYFVKTGKTVSTQTAAAAAPTLEFFSVNAVETQVKDAEDSNSAKVGEAFNTGDVPDIVLTTSDVTAPITSGNGVFKGSVVTAKTDDDQWPQDYNVDWGKATTQPTASAPLAYTTTTNQTKAVAKSTGTTGHTINAKTWIGAQLDQNVYTVTGNIWVNGTTKTGANIKTSGDDVPVLTFVNAANGKTYTFKANSITQSGGHNGQVTFTTKVPKSSAATGSAITGKYDITAKPTANTTIIKYIPGQNLGSANDTSIAAVAALGGTNANTLNVDITANNNQAFTIVLEASTYILNVKDDDATVHTATQNYTQTSTANGPATTTTAGNFTTAPWTANYAYASGKTYTITVTNLGNTTLDVSLNILKATATTTDGANNGYIYGDKATQTGDTATDLASGVDAYNGTTFADLVKSFTLAPTETKVFKVTVPAGMDVNKTARYDFQFTSIEHDTSTVYGPSVTYRLTETITPLKITDIQADNPSTNTWAPKDLAIDSKTGTSIPTGVTVADEVEYKWYVAPKSTTVSFSKTGTGALTGTGVRAVTAAGVSGNNYTLQTADQGMSLYLVAHNKATGNVTEADYVKVADLPYDLDIIVKENTTNVAVADKGNYEVYLRPSTNTGAFTTSETGVIQATADSTNPGVYTASNLVSGTTYKIYTNAVGGTKDNWQDSGETATLAKFNAGTKPEVVYHDVIINNTATDNTPYTISTSDTKFLNNTDATTPIGVSGLEKPTAVLKGTTTKVADPDAAASKWVQNASKITLTYQDWNRDYKLDWLTAASGSVATDPAAAVTTDVTVSAAATTIDTKLTLNLYSVTLTVTGSGTLDEVYMTDSQGNIFTSAATDADNSKLHATGSNPAAGSAFGAGTYTFSVPKDTTYTVKGDATDGTTLEYYKVPATSSTEIKDADIAATTMSVTDNTSTFLINLSALGQYMQVEDDQTPVGGSITAHAAGIAYVQGTTVSNPGTAGSTIEVPYGKTAKDVVVDVRNTSAEGLGNTLYDVTWTAAATNTTDITANADELDDLNGTDLANRASATDPAPEKSLTLSVASGLSVGTYTYVADVTFNSVDGNDDRQAKVTYTLTVKVVPTEFTAVTVVDEDDATVSTVAFGKDLKFSTFTTSTENDWDSTGTPPAAKTLVAGTDYTYQWYHGTANSASVSWSDTGATSAVTVTGATAIAGATSATLDDAVIANYPGEKIYLVISAVKGKNVVKAAISDPVTTGFQPVVKVSVDGTDQSTVSGFDGTGYTVTLSDGATTYNTVWNATKGGFVPAQADGTEISLDATKEYTASVNKYKGASGAAADLVAQTTKLSNASASARTITVPYFTVNAVEVKDYEAIAGLGESVTVPTPTFTLGGATITSDVPVLKDQTVDAKMGNWTEDYKLTWYTKVTTTAPVPGNTPTVSGAYANTNPTMDKGVTQDVTAATGTGITNVAVSGKLYIGGRLDQNTYTITGTVNGPTGGSVTGVTVEQIGADDSVVTTYVWPDNGSDKTGIEADGDGSGTLEHNDSVTFTVVKGDFTITSTPSGSTVIESVKWESETAVDGNVLTKKNVAALSTTNTKTAYDFVINVTGSNLSLGVTDAPTADGDATNDVTATSSTGVNGVGTKTVVRYFSYIDKKNTDSTASDVTSFPLVLENVGNMDLSVGLDVFYFDTTKKSVLNNNYYSASGNWEGASRPNTPVFTAGSTATGSYDIAFATSSGETVLNLADVMKTGTVVPAGAAYKATYAAEDVKAVAAATLNLGTDAWSKDSGVFVFRFKGTSTAGTLVVYYVLDLTVEQLPIVEVSTQVNGDATATGMPGAGDKLQAKGFDADDDESLDNVMVNTSTKPDKTDAATAKLTDDDVKFAWVSVPGTETANKATILSRFTVDANGDLVTSVSGYKVDALAKEYTLTDTDMDRDFYLIAYAPNTTTAPLATNAKDKAISDMVKTKRTVGVKVSLDSRELPISGSADPEYVVYLVEDGKTFDPDNTDGSTGTWATTWNTNSKWYQAAVDVDNITYHVYAPSYKGGSNYVDTGLTLGKNVTTTPVVPYWSVAHTTNVAVDNTNDGFAPYLPSSNTTTKANNQVQDALSVKVSKTKTGAAADGDTLPTPTATAPSTPVLEGMKVQVTVDATKKSNNADTTGKIKKSWSEATDLHTMTTNGWQPDTDTSATSTTQAGVAYPTEDGEGNFLIQSADITVTSAKSFSATLKQVRFTVTFVVKDNTPEGTFTGGLTPKIEGATLKTDKTKETATEAASFTATAASIGTGIDGATVTFNNIPAGAFEIVAVGGEKTNVDGYTWNAVGEEALNDPKYPGTIVQVTSDSDVNTHEGNTIQIQYSSNAIRWYDNFNTADGSLLKDEDGNDAFVRSSGFEKVDTAGTGPFLALTEGYDASKGDVLTYKVRVENTGANDLEDFRITRATAGLTDLTADLTQVTVYDADGNLKAGTVDVTQTGFKLGVGETVEFEVTIPTDQAASSTRYSNEFSVQSSNEGAVAGGNYTPAYQVKPEISFTPGNALVIYGNNEFEPTPTDIAPTWDSDVYDATRFDFHVLSEDDLDDYLDGAARPANAYTTDGMTGGANKLPDWLVFDATTGAVTFDATLYATDVNVQVKDATSFENYTANEVPDEIVFYIKAVDQRTGVAYYTTYTVNVEPNQLEIVGGDDVTLNGIAGNAVNKGDFVYDKVVDEKTHEAIVPTATAPAQNTANGNDAASGTSGKVFVTEDGNSVHTATWTVAAPAYALGVNKHTFTVTYKPENAAEKWNYKPATKEVPAIVVAPAKSLKFGDSVANAADVIPGDLETDYSEIETEGEEGKIPAAMKLTDETFRHNEGITYLDDEPVYTVKLEKVGTIAGVKLTVENTGFKVYDAAGENELDLTAVTIADTGNVDVVFQLKLDEMAPGTNRWVGQHSFKVTAQGEDGTKATYELTLDVAPKTIPKAHVTGLTDPKLDEHPDKTITVTGEDPTDPSKDVELDKFTDKHGNHPITTPKVEITPEDDPYKPGKIYTTTVTLIPDPNYTFEDKTPEEEAPNYTAGGETPDDGYTVTVTPDTDPTKENEKVEYTKTVSIPENGLLKFDDKKLDDGTPSATDPAAKGPDVDLQRGVITISKGGKLGKYEINLGAYDNDITDIKVTQTTNTLPAEGLKWELTPTDIEKLAKDGAKTTYTLDMTEVDTSNLNPGTYSLQLTATGTDPNGHTVTATYTLAIRVSSPPAGGGSAPSCPNQVTFLLGLQGTTNDPVMEMVSNNSKVKSVPNVTALEGYKFIGWSYAAPTGDLDKDSKRALVDPKSVSVTGDLTFYAVYERFYDVPQPPFHEHYVIGYPNGNFGPGDNINRASVATIIARAVLPNFVEGANYGNPGGYSDVDGHWAASAIAYCSKYGVFNGYTDGTFKPDQSITRQELALVMARLSGVKHAQEMPFVDMGDAGEWAVDGIYTAYANGWVNGYTDGTFKPLNPIRRDETVKIFNAYLHRGVNAEGLDALTEYVHSGVASNVTENGTTEYMTWPDVTRDQWAYYEIIEAANDHEFAVDPTVPSGYVVPETWEKCWIDEKWRYHDDLTDGGPTTGLLAAGFRIWSK